MCGRLNVKDDPLAQQILVALGIKVSLHPSDDLRPTEHAATLVWRDGIVQQDATWGIKPDWSRQLIINAQAESVSEKRTFRHAFRKNRCVVPCSGWYEWSGTAGGKQKLLFQSGSGEPLYMAGLLYQDRKAVNDSAFVTLTCAPDPEYRRYHHRMPLLLHEASIEKWLSESPSSLNDLLCSPNLPLTVNQ